MAKKHPIEIFMPPNILKAKLGGGIGGIDMAAIQRAEKALETLKCEFSDWITADVQNLGTALDAFAKSPSKDSCSDLYRASHDLKGQAVTYEFPLVASIAASLCRLLDGLAEKSPASIIEAHANAIRNIVKNDIRHDTDKIALVLAGELETGVAELLKKAGVDALR